MERKRGIEVATAHSLTGLVDYADGAVVSKVLGKSAAGNLTLFAFDQDQELSEHSAPFDAFVQVVDGQGEFTVGGKPVAVSAGELILMPAGIPHAVKATTRFKMLLTMFKGEPNAQ